jgi:hypothetical protein
LRSAARGRDRRFLARFADRQTLGENELHIGHADEAEDHAHELRLPVVAARGVLAAACCKDVGLLAG